MLSTIIIAAIILGALIAVTIRHLINKFCKSGSFHDKSTSLSESTITVNERQELDHVDTTSSAYHGDISKPNTLSHLTGSSIYSTVRKAIFNVFNHLTYPRGPDKGLTSLKHPYFNVNFSEDEDTVLITQEAETENGKDLFQMPSSMFGRFKVTRVHTVEKTRTNRHTSQCTSTQSNTGSKLKKYFRTDDKEKSASSGDSRNNVVRCLGATSSAYVGDISKPTALSHSTDSAMYSTVRKAIFNVFNQSTHPRVHCKRLATSKHSHTKRSHTKFNDGEDTFLITQESETENGNDIIQGPTSVSGRFQVTRVYAIEESQANLTLCSTESDSSKEQKGTEDSCSDKKASKTSDTLNKRVVFIRLLSTESSNTNASESDV